MHSQLAVLSRLLELLGGTRGSELNWCLKKRRDGNATKSSPPDIVDAQRRIFQATAQATSTDYCHLDCHENPALWGILHRSKNAKADLWALENNMSLNARGLAIQPLSPLDIS
jgi:hypothetical protein